MKRSLSRINLLFCSMIILSSFFIPSFISHLQIRSKPDPFFAQDDPISTYNSTLTYDQRKDLYLNLTKNSTGFFGQAARIYLGIAPDEDVIRQDLEEVNAYEDCSDFDVNGYLRMLYFDNETHVMSSQLRQDLKDTLLKFKYWITEPHTPDAPSSKDMYFWTENHMILFHAAELLAGQLYRNETFVYSGMTGQDHIDHAIPLIDRWLNWRGQFGFSEWHSDIYFSLDLGALLNIVEFAENTTIATKAAMVVDLIGFDFANNFFLGKYATTHGRTEDSKKVGTSYADPASWESPAQAAWLMLGISKLRESDTGNRGAVSLATSDRYTPPPILEDIAWANKFQHEHKERSSLDLADGPDYGIGYTSEEDLMFWWPMSAPAAPEIIDATLSFMDANDLSTKLVFNDAMFLDLLKIGAATSGTSLSGFCEILSDVTRGVALQSISTYTYRTPYYQLSGAQDYQKGTNGIQEHIWQATLDENAIVYANSPGGVSPQIFTGGWKPRATMYQNVGIFQYDRLAQTLLGEIVFMYLKSPQYTHAYFPQWAFDEVTQAGKWTFGQKNQSYVALYSYNPTYWATDYELRSDGKKNAYIIELASTEEYDNLDAFQAAILANPVRIKHLPVGYQIIYSSPSQGEIRVAWDGDMTVEDQAIDLGPFPRYENPYCSQAFGTNITLIEFENQTLTLNFETGDRIYEEGD